MAVVLKEFLEAGVLDQVTSSTITGTKILVITPTGAKDQAIDLTELLKVLEKHEDIVLTDNQTVVTLANAPSGFQPIRVFHHRPTGGSFGELFVGTAGQTPDFTLLGNDLSYQFNTESPFAAGDILRISYQV